MLVLSSNNPNQYFLWSSYQDLNILNIDRLVMPVVQYRSIDKNGDGKNDEVFFNLLKMVYFLPTPNFL